MSFKILVVDDEKDLRDLICYFLKRENFTVETAENGKDAFNKIKEGRPDLVISDIRMPDWDGFELLSNVSRLENQFVPVLFISGYVGGDEAELKKNPHCMGFISKPISKTKLIEIVKEAQAKQTISPLNWQPDHE
ncbi:response regulator [Bdellovibrio svalbardensis]|uniref:Response regulator n=1 Tax=Bdellovibrio svalbardensis TaxID=2972972 RepID=A0ABT6DN86_9BACT|nr:response regulator [Bdellovibrio svalbardensis]MDG0817399.1 response regulator [Bdellovibrio svalbardensis]